MDREKIYISGPISGVAGYKFYFYVAEGHIEQQYGEDEVEVVNPVRFCKPGWSWLRCMAVCLWKLLRCESIYMLRGWSKSRGARIEHKVAELLGIDIIYE